MDWGLGNPNKTGTLIAVLMVALWLLAGMKRVGFEITLALFVGLGVCLVQTASRGALVAVMTGFAF